MSHRQTQLKPLQEVHKKQAVNSPWRTIKILEPFESEESMTANQLNKRLSFPESSVSEILSTLFRENSGKGWWQKQISSGIRFFELRNTVRAGVEIRKVATYFLKELNQELETYNIVMADIQSATPDKRVKSLLEIYRALES